jgi:hypothetical protein
MKILLLKKAKGTEDSVVLNGAVYRVRFTPKHAEHVLDNYNSRDGIHDIKPREIVAQMIGSLMIRDETKTGAYACIGLHRNKIYETRVFIEKDCLNVKTSFLCNKPPYIELFKLYYHE